MDNEEKTKTMYDFLINYHYMNEDDLVLYNTNTGRYVLKGSGITFMVLTPEELQREAEKAILDNLYRFSNTFIADHAYYCPPDADDVDAHGYMEDAISDIKRMGADISNKIIRELVDMEAFLDDATWHGCDYRMVFNAAGQHCYENYVIMEFIG